MEHRLNQDIYNNYYFLFSRGNICVIFTVSTEDSDLGFTASFGPAKRSDVPSADSNHNVANTAASLRNGFL